MSNTTNNTTLNTLNTLIAEGYKNTKGAIPFVLDGAFAKHGNVPGAVGSRFVKPGWYTRQEGVEHLLFSDLTGGRNWRFVFGGDNLIIAEADIPEGDAVFAAAPLDAIPDDVECVVRALGDHPTLATKGKAVPTNVVTVIVEPDAGKDPDLADHPELAGKPIVATWFPGPSTPPSRPHDCAVGDKLTAAEAERLGWNTVVFE